MRTDDLQRRGPRASGVRVFQHIVACLALLCLGGALSTVHAQVTTSSVTGFITDSSGAVVPQAQVTIKETATGFTRSTQTTAEGGYSIVGIPAGNYTFTVVKTGFKTAIKANQIITQQLPARIDFELQVGAVTQTVNVVGGAPIINTETPTNATTISHEQLTQLPTLGHNYLQQAILSPGVVPTQASSILTIVEGNYFSGGAAFKPVSVDISGGPPEFTGFVEDGFDVRDPIYGGDLYQPTPEAISSFRVARGFDTAQYGGEPNTIYIATKSGTNQYHGSAWEYNQNAAMRARPFGTRGVAPLTYNQFGFTLGGPATPKLKDKTFFFVSVQLTRTRGSSTTLAVLPTAAERNGDLSALPGQIYNPFNIDTATNTRIPFLDNQIPTADISPFATKYMSFLPLPNIPNAKLGSPNFTTNGRIITDDTQYLFRVDQNLPAGGRVFFKFFRDKVNSSAYTLIPEAGEGSPLRGMTGSIEWDQPFGGGNKLNTLRLAVFRSVTDYGTIPTSKNYAGDVFGLKNVNPGSVYWGFPSVGITGWTTIPTLNFNLHRITTRFGINDDLSLIHGRHTFDFGFGFQPNQWPQKNGANPRGRMTFEGPFTSEYPGGPGGASLADFLLGSFVLGSSNPLGFQPFLKTSYWNWFAQDKIKVNRKLTLSLGVRWDYWQPPVERYNRWVAFDQNSGNLVYVLKDPFNFMTDWTTLSGTVPRGMFLNWKKTNFSPRVGIAYMLTPKTVIRAGGGMYYAQGMMNFQVFSTFGNGGPPFANDTTVTNDINQLTPQETVANLYATPLIGAITPGSTVVSPDIHAPQAYVEVGTFSIERELSNNMMVSASYSGDFGHHVMGDDYINQGSLFNPANPLPLAQRRPYPLFGDILLQGNSNNSSYNGLSLHFDKRMSNGSDIVVSYTVSKAIDLFSSNGGGIENQNGRCTVCDRALADFDRRHYLAIGYMWQLPVGPGKRFLQQGPLSMALRDWQWSGITQFASGFALTPSMPSSWPNVGSSVARPNRVCDGRLSNPTMAEWFKTSCFVAQPINTFGNSGRNVIFGPGSQNWDMALQRSFKIGERVKVDLRGEFMSVFNHQNLNNPSTSVTSLTYGEIFGKSNPRIIQVGARLTF